MTAEVVSEVGDAAWRGFLASAPGATLFQAPQMWRVFRETKRYVPQVLAIESRGEVQALMSSAVISYGPETMSRLTGRTVCIGGPLGVPSAIPQILGAHDATASKRSLLTQIRNIAPPNDKAPFDDGGYEWEDHLNYVVDLAPGERALLEGVSKDRRKGIARAERAGLEMRDLEGGDIGPAYALLKGTYKRAGVPLADPSLFHSAHRILCPSGNLWAVAARLRGAPCAVRFVLRWEGTLYDWYGGSSDEGRAVHADEWLVWELLRRGIEAGCEKFDFGGAGKPNEPYGPREFKRRFGGTLTNPGRFEKRYRPIVARVAKAAITVGRQIGWAFA